MTIFSQSASRLAFVVTVAVAATIGVAAPAASAVTTLPQYLARGTQNPVNYTFTAAHTGDIIAWFTGSTAGYTENLGLLINGVPTVITGLNNESSVYGEKLVLGHANAGDNLVFFTNVANTNKTYYSDKSLSADGVNHVFSAAYAGDAKLPAGTYVAFEDLWNGGDFNYFDETFVFDNVATSVPEPASWALMVVGFGMGGHACHHRRIVVRHCRRLGPVPSAPPPPAPAPFFVLMACPSRRSHQPPPDQRHHDLKLATSVRCAALPHAVNAESALSIRRSFSMWHSACNQLQARAVTLLQTGAFRTGTPCNESAAHRPIWFGVE